METDDNAETVPASRLLVALVNVFKYALTVYAVGWVLPTLVIRLAFPGILEHQESMTIYLLDQMVQSPANLYAPPGLHIGSVIYNPVYFFYLWVLYPIIGLNASAIRIASVVPPLLASALLIEWIGRKKMNLTLLGVGWCIVSLALYPLVTWIDLARLEAMLLLSIILLWFTLCIDDQRRGKFVAVGLAIALSFAVKQPSALLVLVPLALAAIDRRYLISVAVAIGGIAAFVGVLWLAYGDDYLFWTIREPAHHRFWFSMSIINMKEIVAVAPIIIGCLMLLLATPIDLPSPEGKLVVIMIVTFVIAAMGAGKEGGSVAQYVLFLFLTTIFATRMTRTAFRTGAAFDFRIALAIFIMLSYSVALSEAGRDRHQIRPSSEDREQQAALLRVLESTDQETWVPTWPHLNVWTGHTTYPTLMAQVMTSKSMEEVKAAIKKRRFALIILTLEYEGEIQPLVEENYVHYFSLPLRRFRERMFLPTEVWARQPEDAERARRAWMTTPKS